MRLLDRYLLRELFVPLGYCLGGFLIFWMSSDLITRLDELQANKLKGLDVAHYYALQLPEFAVQVAPIGLLLALLYSLTNHARHNELTAIRAAGVSLWRMCLPYLGVGWLLSGGLSIVNELIVPPCSVLAEQVLTQHQAGRSDARPVSFVNSSAHRSWYIEAYHKDTAVMIRPRVVWNLPDGSRRELSAERGGRMGDQWVFFEVQLITYSNRSGALPVPSQTNTLYVPEFEETPAQIESEMKVSGLSNIQAARKAQLSVPEILNYVRLHPKLSPEMSAKLYTQLHTRLAAPWTALVVVLIAIPFGAVSGRRNAYVGVASSIFIAFAFFVVSKFGMAFGVGGQLPPWVAAWLPNILFAATGFVLTCRMR